MYLVRLVIGSVIGWFEHPLVTIHGSCRDRVSSPAFRCRSPTSVPVGMEELLPVGASAAAVGLVVSMTWNWSSLLSRTRRRPCPHEECGRGSSAPGYLRIAWWPPAARRICRAGYSTDNAVSRRQKGSGSEWAGHRTWRYVGDSLGGLVATRAPRGTHILDSTPAGVAR